MWAFSQRNLAMCSVQRCWKGGHLERWFSGPTSSPPFMCWVITSRSHSQLKSSRGESTRIQSNSVYSYWKHASPRMGFRCNLTHFHLNCKKSNTTTLSATHMMIDTFLVVSCVCFLRGLITFKIWSHAQLQLFKRNLNVSTVDNLHYRN